MIDIRCCDALELLKSLADESVHCIVTSPPYFGLRDYQVDGQIGLEETPQAFIAKLVEIFHEATRVLRDDGTLWVNMGDTYVGTGDKGDYRDPKYKNGRTGQAVAINRKVNGLPSKNLLGIPWRLAFALQDDGWILRSDIIWSKPAPMPESVTDRPTKAHEYIFMFAKQGRYYFDQDAVREKSIEAGRFITLGEKSLSRGQSIGASRQASGNALAKGVMVKPFRNLRSVWTVPSEPFSEAHFATYPTKLIEPCIKAGCPVGGIVLDPFMGAGTTGLVALRLGRNFIGCDINPDYVDMSKRRIANADPFQATDKGNGIIQRSLFE